MSTGNMSRVLYVAVIVSVAICVVWSDETHVIPAEQCKGLNIEDLKERVDITPCGKSRCKLRRGTNATVKLRFKPTREVKTLTLDVYGILSEIPLPFIGVTGTSACDRVTSADTGAPAACPLAAGVDYSYVRSFPIESFYPTLSLRVHWSLKDEEGDVICFEVPAVIK